MENYTLDNFIMVYDDFIGSDYCNSAIDYFHQMEKAGLTATRLADNWSSHRISDTNIALHGDQSIKLEYSQKFSSGFLEAFWTKAHPKYIEKYGILNDAEQYSVCSLKMQRTKIGEGYHMWHFETGKKNDCFRIMTFILYLNDVDVGGETEFLYYPKRIQAKKGRLLLFPGAFTHTHRGNTTISNEKYILTGWLEF